jgi:hypothetical protein
MSNAAHPTCARCGGRITLFECLWRELGSGAVRASYAVDLEGIRRHDRRIWHVGCLVPQAAGERAAQRLAAPPVLSRELAAAAA